MKKDRNCGMSYPVYPPYQMPMMGMPVPFNMQSQSIQNNDQFSNLQQRINNLEKRVSDLENMSNQNNSINYSNQQYSSSNYPMM